MRRLSLRAYSALARPARERPKSYSEPEPRPDGCLIWAVVPDQGSYRAVRYLQERLQALIGPISLLVTSRNGRLVEQRNADAFEILPPDNPAACTAFLQHWRPDLCLWIGGDLQPVLIAQSRAAQIPMLMVGADAAFFDQKFWRWWPALARDALASFASLSAVSEESAALLKRLSGGRRDIAVRPPLQRASTVPGADAHTLEELREHIAGRPVWVAAGVQKEEIMQVLEAQRASTRLTHRLLLILVCANFPVSLDARQMLKAQGWQVCHWEDGDPLDNNTQVVLVEDMDELGLWYRLAPVSFLGGTMVQGHSACDPYVPAALGSAIIYGPKLGAHLISYSRLASVGAARIVHDADALAQALQQLLAVDQAAAMAHAAWELVSQGAETTDQVITEIQDVLDAKLSEAAREQTGERR